MPLSGTDTLWFVLVGTAIILMFAGFFVATVLLNQKRFIRVQREKLQESERLQEILRQRPKQMLAAQEEERKRVARELHDGISQMISSIAYRIRAIQAQLPPNPSGMQAINSLEGLSSDLGRTIDEVRRISHNLRSKQVDELGFDAAVRDIVDDFSQRTSITVEFRSEGDESISLPPEVELGLFRIIQESLRNIEKHSHATSVSIDSRKGRSMYEMTISDNGTGLLIDTSDAGTGGAASRRRATGIGLTSMRERAELLGGTCDIRSSEGEGTKISLRIPLRTMG